MAAGSVFFFFFFKQKTAYEIVDCDWSSDVCSSDLHLIIIGTFTGVGVFAVVMLSLNDLRYQQQERYNEIGRASCRERV